MTSAALTREELVEEVDQALAALRRVIVRALDAPAKPPTILQTIRAAAPRPVAQPGKTILPPRTPVPREIPESLQRVAVAGIEIDIEERTVFYRGASAVLSRRQIQLAAVLARASPNFISRSDATARAWPDIAAASREVAITEAIRSMAYKLLPLRLKAEAIRGYGLRLWAMEDGARLIAPPRKTPTEEI